MSPTLLSPTTTVPWSAKALGVGLDSVAAAKSAAKPRELYALPHWKEEIYQ
jgi:hypothetical protein